MECLIISNTVYRDSSIRSLTVAKPHCRLCFHRYQVHPYSLVVLTCTFRTPALQLRQKACEFLRQRA